MLCLIVIKILNLHLFYFCCCVLKHNKSGQPNNPRPKCECCLHSTKLMILVKSTFLNTESLSVSITYLRDSLQIHPAFFQLQLTAVRVRLSVPQLMLLHLKCTLKNADIICFNSHLYNKLVSKWIISIYSCMLSLVFINGGYGRHPPTSWPSTLQLYWPVELQPPQWPYLNVMFDIHVISKFINLCFSNAFGGWGQTN